MELPQGLVVFVHYCNEAAMSICTTMFLHGSEFLKDGNSTAIIRTPVT